MPWSRCLPTIRRGGSDSIQIIQPAYWHDSSGLADKGLELGCSDLQGEKQGLDAVDSENCDISRATSDSNVETAAEVSISPPRRAPDPQRRAPSACGTVDVEVPDRNGPVLFLYPHRRTHCALSSAILSQHMPRFFLSLILLHFAAPRLYSSSQACSQSSSCGTSHGQ